MEITQTQSPAPPEAIKPRSPLVEKAFDIFAVLARWGLGGMFVYMGLTKALHPEQFLKLIRQYEMFSSPLLLNSIAAALPWFEVFCGLLLVLGIAVRGSALMLVGMLIPFTIVVIQRAVAIAGTQGVLLCAVKFDCGCGNGEVVICHKVLENCLLMLLSGWLLSGRGKWLSLRFALLPGK